MVRIIAECSYANEKRIDVESNAESKRNIAAKKEYRKGKEVAHSLESVLAFAITAFVNEGSWGPDRYGSSTAIVTSHD